MHNSQIFCRIVAKRDIRKNCYRFTNFYCFRPRGWNGSQGAPAPEMKQSGMRPVQSGEGMHRRRMPDYPPSHELKRRYSPGREADMRARKKMR